MEAVAQEGAAWPDGDHAGEAHSSGLGAAGDSQGQARREARKARSEGHRARAYRRATACRALLRPEADGRGGPAGPAQEAQAVGQTGFALSQPNRTAYVLQLQTLLLEANEDANDHEEGDSGINGRSLRRRATFRGRKRKRGLRSSMGYEWTEEAEEAFEVEAVVSKVVADG
eukprot:6188588-Pleurochrysis_carterae.AAC.2